MSKEHDCPQCGQDMRLPADTYTLLRSIQKTVRTLDVQIERLFTTHWPGGKS